MTIYKAYQFRLYPTLEQREKLNQFLGSSRFIYNHYLSEKQSRYEAKKESYSLGDMKKDLKDLQVTYPFLKEVDGTLLRTTLENLDIAYQRFYKNQGGYPKYKRRGNDSYRTVCIRSSYKGREYVNIKVDLEKKVIKLPKIDEIKIRGYRKLEVFPYHILSVTVKRRVNKYYVTVNVVEEKAVPEFIPIGLVGIDLGVKSLITTSDGIKYDKMTFITKVEKRIKGLQRGLARCERGSKNREKLVQKIRRSYEKIRNMRKYYTHSITSTLVKENSIIVTETLKVRKMIESQKRYLAKEISNATFQEIMRQLKYKSSWSNKKFYQVETYYPSSQICNRCGKRERKIKELNIREWECTECGSRMDRDINASINILYKGLEQYYKEELQS